MLSTPPICNRRVSILVSVSMSKNGPGVDENPLRRGGRRIVINANCSNRYESRFRIVRIDCRRCAWVWPDNDKGEDPPSIPEYCRHEFEKVHRFIQTDLNTLRALHLVHNTFVIGMLARSAFLSCLCRPDLLTCSSRNYRLTLSFVSSATTYCFLNDFRGKLTRMGFCCAKRLDCLCHAYAMLKN